MLESTAFQRAPAMQVHLLLPGLLWPNQGRNVAAHLDLPALSMLLGRGRCTWSAASSLEQCLLQSFAVPEGAGYAALRRIGESRLPAAETGQHWLAADPVHLHFAREHLLLADSQSHAVTLDEATALVETLNQNFPDIGHFEAGASDRWYLRLEQPTDAVFFPPGDVLGRPISHFLPEGPEARRWQHFMNEVQIVLYNHPINQTREAHGRPTINSVWLWGQGQACRPRAPFSHLRGAHPLLQGLAQAAATACPPFDAGALPGGDVLVVDDQLLTASRYLDLQTWQANLQTLEAGCIAPLLTALRNGTCTRLLITVPGDHRTLQIELSRFDLRRFWRRPRTLDTLLGTTV